MPCFCSFWGKLICKISPRLVPANIWGAFPATFDGSHSKQWISDCYSVKVTGQFMAYIVQFEIHEKAAVYMIKYLQVVWG